MFDGSQDLDVNSSMAAEGRPLAAEAKWTSVLEGAQPFFLADRTAFLIRVRKDPLHRSRDMRFSHPQRSRRCFFDEQFSSPSFSEISSGSALPGLTRDSDRNEMAMGRPLVARGPARARDKCNS